MLTAADCIAIGLATYVTIASLVIAYREFSGPIRDRRRDEAWDEYLKWTEDPAMHPALERYPAPWHTRKCSTKYECWCRVIVTTRGLTDDADEHCVVGAGSIGEAEADLIVKAVNEFAERAKCADAS